MARLLFVCMGNICRSPTAEAVMAHLLQEEGLAHAVTVDSAGTGAWHAGNPPDQRSAEAAAGRGITLSGAARPVDEDDFTRFDLLLCADTANARDLLARLPEDHPSRERVRLLREFDPQAVASGDLDVPDPYYGGPHGFEHVLDVVTAACTGLLARLRDGSLVTA